MGQSYRLQNRFYYWIKTLKRQAASALDAPREFIPISAEAVSCLTRSSIEPPKERIIQVKAQDIKITYPNGVILQLESGCDLEILRQLITLTP